MKALCRFAGLVAVAASCLQMRPALASMSVSTNYFDVSYNNADGLDYIDFNGSVSCGANDGTHVLVSVGFSYVYTDADGNTVGNGSEYVDGSSAHSGGAAIANPYTADPWMGTRTFYIAFGIKNRGYRAALDYAREHHCGFYVCYVVTFTVYKEDSTVYDSRSIASGWFGYAQGHLPPPEGE